MPKRKTNEEFLREVYDLVGNEYTFLDKYKTNKTKIKVKHNSCDTIYDVRPNDFLNGKRCPKCSNLNKGNNRRKTTEQFKSEVYDLVGDDYTVLDEYTNDRTKIKVRHNKCDTVYEVTPSAFLQGNRCPNCYGVFKKDTKRFKQEVYDLVGDEYSVLGEYVNSQTKILMKHNRCDNTYTVKPSVFLHGTRCPYCYQKGSSHGNEVIAKYLNEHNINYEREYRFKDCVYERPLPFDFYLKEYNITIEYDGEQHYVRNDFFEKHDPFKERQIKDRIKSKYCHQNGIKLIRIKYTQFNQIEDILDKELTN